jgi:hypothetical protein
MCVSVQMGAVAMSPVLMDALGRHFSHPHIVHGHTIPSHSFSDLEKTLYPIMAFGVVGVFFGVMCNVLVCRGVPKEPPTLESITSGGVAYNEIQIGGSANKRRARGSLAKVKTVN